MMLAISLCIGLVTLGLGLVAVAIIEVVPEHTRKFKAWLRRTRKGFLEGREAERSFRVEF